MTNLRRADDQPTLSRARSNARDGAGRGALTPLHLREQRQAQQRAREERKKEASELLGLTWPEPPRKGAGRPTFEDQHKAALYQAVKSDAPYLDRSDGPREHQI